MTIWNRLKQFAKTLKKDLFTLTEAVKHSSVPWYAKVLAAIVVAYAFSPIDLIPDFIPILGYVDDLLLVPFGIYIVLKLIPPSVLAECREVAETKAKVKQKNWSAAIIILLIWIAIALWLFRSFYSH